MTGARAIAREAERRRRVILPAVEYANRYTNRIGEVDSEGRLVPPIVREYAARLIAWAVRRVK